MFSFNETDYNLETIQTSYLKLTCSTPAFLFSGLRVEYFHHIWSRVGCEFVKDILPFQS